MRVDFDEFIVARKEREREKERKKERMKERKKERKKGEKETGNLLSRTKGQYGWFPQTLEQELRDFVVKPEGYFHSFFPSYFRSFFLSQFLKSHDSMLNFTLG